MLLAPKEKKKKASPELVGRPLVPFFDAGTDNVNHNLSKTATEREDMEVDARVWNPEGYFEYPSAEKEGKKNPASGTSSSSDATTTNGGKLILAMLQGGDTNTTTSNAVQQQSSSSSVISNSPSKKILSIEKSTKSSKTTTTSSSSKKKTSSKSKNFAWSAFQSSPDPQSLPLPSLSPLSLRKFSEDEDPEASAFLLDSPPKTEIMSETTTGSSVEQSMTKDLRKLLNLGQ